jgi:major membrane immunogen (membrane-anchored lipoprotein)
MKKRHLLLLMVSALLYNGCSTGEKTESLTAQKIEAYLNSYKELRQKAPDLLYKANSENVDAQTQGFSDFEGVTKNNGLSYKEFVIINAKVGAVYSVLNAQDFMNVMGNMKEQGMDQMDEGMKQMQAQIDDPNVPAEAKEEMKKALEEMKKGKADVNAEFDKNKEWADLVLNKTKSLTNLFISKEEADLVKQYFDKITEAYTGGVMPTNFNVNP